jgi:hypothetical protein
MDQNLISAHVGCCLLLFLLPLALAYNESRRCFKSLELGRLLTRDLYPNPRKWQLVVSSNYRYHFLGLQ